MSDQPRPALPPGRWAEPSVEGPGAAARIDGGAVEAQGRFAGDERHALAALALHGQPFGFTWKDVDMLRSTVLADDLHSHDDWWELQRLGSRIAALLPPREQASLPVDE